ncbi:MAG TPA: hypothetical protein VJ608_15105 [Albitalea sp.]|nr:hypothetical protein [Albitalea sp.]HJW11482.1 hypothetical protein [Albitalea sp.]
MAKIDVFQPRELFSNDPPALESFGFRFLAEGDSWFSIGTLNLLANSNLLFEMDFQRSACAVNCAKPGDTLKRMTELHTDPNFTRLLFGRQARFWDAIVMSCGGNDLIEAVGSPSVDGAGHPVPPERRLLLTRDEWGPASQGASRYLSEAGWKTFTTYLQANFDQLIALRDRGPSRGQPIFVHGYAVPVPRPAGAGLGAGPWLFPSLQAFAIPPEDGAALAQELIMRLGRLLAATAADGARFPRLHFFDSAAIALTPAEPGTGGVSGDWINEIHLTRAGYRKIAVPWAAAIEAAL